MRIYMTNSRRKRQANVKLSGLQLRRYFHIGKRHRVNVFEANNLETKAQETSLH